MPSDVLMNRHMAKLGMAPQPVSWSEGSLTIHEVSKFFSVPIAEAASKLSVCGSVLQRICKENGIARWPYRKVTAGKSIEEIIEEGLKELANNPGAYKIADKQPPHTPENNTSRSPSATPLSGTIISSDAATNVGHPSPKRLARQQQDASTPAAKPSPRAVSASAAQTTSSAPGTSTPPMQVHHQSSPSPMTTSPAAAATPPKPKPDEFKLGFPSNGLRRHSTRWWGASESDAATAATAALAGDDSRGSSDVESGVEGLESGGSGDAGVPTASSLLVKTRKRASRRGRGAMAHAVTRGYGLQRLGAKDAATLRFVFGEHLPKHWTPAFPPVL